MSSNGVTIRESGQEAGEGEGRSLTPPPTSPNRVQRKGIFMGLRLLNPIPPTRFRSETVAVASITAEDALSTFHVEQEEACRTLSHIPLLLSQSVLT